MPKFRIVPATEAHVEEMATRVRAADVEELWASGRKTPVEAMRLGIQVSTDAWAGLVDGEVMCVFGVAPYSMLTGTGVPWMVGSTLIDRHASRFAMRCRPVVNRMLDDYPHLVNYVDSRNRRAIRWLRWLGFEVGEPEPYGWQGIPFHRFEMTREVSLV